MAVRSVTIGTTYTQLTPTFTQPTAVTLMIFCNLETPDPLDADYGLQYVSIRVGPEGVADGSDTYTILNQVPLDAGDSLTLQQERFILDAGDAIYASTTSPANLSATVSYVSI